MVFTALNVVMDVESTVEGTFATRRGIVAQMDAIE